MIGKILFYIKKGCNKLIRDYETTLFRVCGSDVYIGKNCTFTYRTIELGNHVYFGNNCVVQSAHGSIKIGSHVMLGPGVHLHGGDHVSNQVGIYMDEAHKEYGQDPDLIIQDDVWIGANAIVLKGVTIGEGTIIGAGSVVTKDIPPYSISVGNPARVVRQRFTPEEIAKHKELLKMREKS